MPKTVLHVLEYFRLQNQWKQKQFIEANHQSLKLHNLFQSLLGKNLSLSTEYSSINFFNLLF